eukprot:361767-Chlamydomonas_euryale.AAC.4
MRAYTAPQRPRPHPAAAPQPPQPRPSTSYQCASSSGRGSNGVSGAPSAARRFTRRRGSGAVGCAAPRAQGEEPTHRRAPHRARLGGGAGTRGEPASGTQGRGAGGGGWVGRSLPTEACMGGDRGTAGMCRAWVCDARRGTAMASRRSRLFPAVPNGRIPPPDAAADSEGAASCGQLGWAGQALALQQRSSLRLLRVNLRPCIVRAEAMFKNVLMTGSYYEEACPNTWRAPLKCDGAFAWCRWVAMQSDMQDR